jgi:hypothetical protein
MEAGKVVTGSNFRTGNPRGREKQLRKIVPVTIFPGPDPSHFVSKAARSPCLRAGLKENAMLAPRVSKGTKLKQ